MNSPQHSSRHNSDPAPGEHLERPHPLHVTHTQHRRPAADFKLKEFAVNPDRSAFDGRRTPKVSSSHDVTGSDLWLHCAFKKILLDIEADAQNQIIALNAVIDVYFLTGKKKTGYSPQDAHKNTPGPSTNKEELKLGRVSFWGNLVPGASAKDLPKWNVRIEATSKYEEKDAKHLPELLREIGPGAFITAVVHSLFGTKHGLKMLEIEGYLIPEADVGETSITHKH